MNKAIKSQKALISEFSGINVQWVLSIFLYISIKIWDTLALFFELEDLNAFMITSSEIINRTKAIRIDS